LSDESDGGQQDRKNNTTASANQSMDTNDNTQSGSGTDGEEE